MRDYISKSLNMYWLGIKDDWDKYAKNAYNTRKAGPIPEKKKTI